MGKIRKKSCLGCTAYELYDKYSDGWCNLGYETESIEMVCGFYGRNKQLIGCKLRPIEECPKPRTVRLMIKLHREKEQDKDWARERMGILGSMTIEYGKTPDPSKENNNENVSDEKTRTV